MTAVDHFDYLVIGGGSGGMATARRAAEYGAKVALVEKAALGGTCVNVGCVPKKVMFNAATTNEVLHQSHHFGFQADASLPQLQWDRLKTARDSYIKRLNGIYQNNLSKNRITIISGSAEFASERTIKVVSADNPNGNCFSADHIVIAVGGKPSVPTRIPGIEHCITSDGFFQLSQQPKSVAVVGGGYIGVELAGIFNSLGSKTTLFLRSSTPLHNFDDLLVKTLVSEMKKQDLLIASETNPKEIVKAGSDLFLIDDKGENHGPFEQILFATGRVPNVAPLKLDLAGVHHDPKKGTVPVNEFQETNVKGIYAIGDVIGKVPLTPMAIAAGRRLADR